MIGFGVVCKCRQDFFVPVIEFKPFLRVINYQPTDLMMDIELKKIKVQELSSRINFF